MVIILNDNILNKFFNNKDLYNFSKCGYSSDTLPYHGYVGIIGLNMLHIGNHA